MKSVSASVVKLLSLVLVVGALAACGLPRPGPNKSEIFQGKTDENSETEIVLVNETINRLVKVKSETHFPGKLLNAASPASDRIAPGDTLSLTIYENVAEGVLTRGGAGNTTLDSIQVDDAGFIFIPYAGRVRAAGNTPDRLRQIITDKLRDLTPEPQVLVQRATGDGATVAMLGDGIGAQGVFPIQRSSRHLMDMLATAGGITAPAEVVRITLLRGHTKGEMWFEDVYDRPELNFALRAGDQVLVQRDPRTFTALGATGAQTNQQFESRQPSALEAMGQIGGLNGSVADPTGIFVIRNEDAAIANRVLGRSDLRGQQSMVYVLDLTAQNGLPLAQEFDIRDGDAIFVTEAPTVVWSKTLSALTGAIGAALLFTAFEDN